jgi:DNA-binding MarR family transcriptional regulator
MEKLMNPPDDVSRFRAQWARELPDLDTSGMDILGRARRIVLRSRPAIEAVFAGHGIDAGEFDVLSTLCRSGAPYALRPTELYKSLMISSGGLTARLTKLEKAGLIVRPSSTDDARSTLVQLTPAGRTKVEAAFREDMALESRMIAGLSQKQKSDFTTLLMSLEASLDAALCPDRAAALGRVADSAR